MLSCSATMKNQNAKAIWEVNWGEPQRAPQLRVDSDFRHSRYIYIYINRASDRLALCPRRSNQNPAQIPYFEFAFSWLWLTMISSRKDAFARALFFVSSPTTLGVQLPFETSSIRIFLTSVLSFFTRLPHTRDRRLASKLQLSISVAVDWLSSFGSVRKRCSNALRKQPIRGIESSTSKWTSLIEPWAVPPFRLLSAGPCLHCVTVHCLASSQRSMTSPRKGATSFPSTKTEGAVQGSPHNACIP